jgi:hypothetical protein
VSTRFCSEVVRRGEVTSIMEPPTGNTAR